MKLADRLECGDVSLRQPVKFGEPTRVHIVVNRTLRTATFVLPKGLTVCGQRFTGYETEVGRSAFNANACKMCVTRYGLIIGEAEDV
jgi:hypothetical protein